MVTWKSLPLDAMLEQRTNSSVVITILHCESTEAPASLGGVVSKMDAVPLNVRV
jgi:hypothetical protein